MKRSNRGISEQSIHSIENMRGRRTVSHVSMRKECGMIQIPFSSRIALTSRESADKTPGKVGYGTWKTGFLRKSKRISASGVCAFP